MSPPPAKPSLNRWVRLSRVYIFAGSMLVFWPISWALTMSAYTSRTQFSSYVVLMLYGLVGAALLHSTGNLCGACIWNDILDRDIDRKVERTKDRPIASGEVSVPAALVFMGIHLVLMFVCISPFNKPAWQLAFLSIVPLPGIYPILKRITYWPQAWLGVAVNFPALVAGVAIAPSPYWPSAIPSAIVVLAGWSWAVYYDTVYSSQDKKFDVKAGVKSTALFFGDYVRPMLFVFATMMVGSLIAAGLFNNQGPWFFAVSAGGAAIHLIWQILSVDLDSPASCLKNFESNAWQLGGIVWAGTFLDYMTIVL